MKRLGSDCIDVREYGERGPTVVVLHGGPGAPGSVASLARDLATNSRVLEPLQRRSGGEPLTVDRHCRDLAAVAPDRALLVGWSWGAMLALSFAARYPERTSAVVLVGCGTYDETTRGLYRRAMDDRLGPDGRARVRELERRLFAETDPAKREPLFAELAGILTRAQCVEPIEAERESLPIDVRGHEETWRDVLRLQRDGAEPARFRAITAPVLMLHGDDDPHPGKATRDLLRRYVPHLEYTGFALCGHSPWLESHARNVFLTRLRDWLSLHVE